MLKMKQTILVIAGNGKTPYAEIRQLPRFDPIMSIKEIIQASALANSARIAALDIVSGGFRLYHGLQNRPLTMQSLNCRK